MDLGPTKISLNYETNMFFIFCLYLVGVVTKTGLNFCSVITTESWFPEFSCYTQVTPKLPTEVTSYILTEWDRVLSAVVQSVLYFGRTPSLGFAFG